MGINKVQLELALYDLDIVKEVLEKKLEESELVLKIKDAIEALDKKLLYVYIFRNSEVPPRTPIEMKNPPFGWSNIPQPLLGTELMYISVGSVTKDELGTTLITWSDPVPLGISNKKEDSIIFQYLAYRAASSLVEALVNFSRNNTSNPPSGFSSNSNIILKKGELIYVTTARMLNGKWLRWQDGDDAGYIWSTPICLGDGTTSNTGADGLYNYIYCRTTQYAAPIIPKDLTVDFMEDLCQNTNDIGYSTSGFKSMDIEEVWYDHPTGIEKDYPYEWVAISRNGSTYEPPVLWSKWGEDGKDGDGVEYIYTLIKPNSWAYPLKGRVGETSRTYYTIDPLRIENNQYYQLDDFIPENWHDTPTEVSELNPNSYVSIRKKKNGKWQLFSEPALWSHYSIPVELKEQQLTLKLSILRPRGGWKPNTLYLCNETDSTGNKYLDSVSYGGDFYICKKSHTSSTIFSKDLEKWERMTDVGNVVAEAILANLINTKGLSAEEVVILDDLQLPIAGMTANTTKYNLGDTILWAGSDKIPAAPFKVSKDGKLTATNANIAGDILASSFQTISSGSNSLNVKLVNNEFQFNTPNSDKPLAYFKYIGENGETFTDSKNLKVTYKNTVLLYIWDGKEYKVVDLANACMTTGNSNYISKIVYTYIPSQTFVTLIGNTVNSIILNYNSSNNTYMTEGTFIEVKPIQCLCPVYRSNSVLARYYIISNNSKGNPYTAYEFTKYVILNGKATITRSYMIPAFDYLGTDKVTSTGWTYHDALSLYTIVGTDKIITLAGQELTGSSRTSFNGKKAFTPAANANKNTVGNGLWSSSAYSM